MSTYDVKRIDEMETAYGGAMRLARAALGVTSFGMQVEEFPPNFDQYPEHSHSEDGQENWRSARTTPEERSPSIRHHQGATDCVARTEQRTTRGATR